MATHAASQYAGKSLDELLEMQCYAVIADWSPQEMSNLQDAINQLLRELPARDPYDESR
jgi:hypothetical protein